MAFCTNCGAQVSGRFCEKCGATIGGEAPAPPAAPPPPAYQQPQYQQQAYSQPLPPPAKKGTSPWVWILGGLALILVLGVISVVGMGFFIAKKAKDAGIDSSLAQTNPVLAAAKMMVALNPEVEVVKSDDSAGTITIREKKTGKTITMSAEDIKNGKISFTEEGSGETMTFGGGGKLPSWVPSYPGSKPEGVFSATGGEGEGGSARFTTTDPAAKVVEFYQNALKSAGYKITTSTAGDSSGMVAGEDQTNNRTVMATIGAEAGETNVVLTYGVKK
jgi:hypothetical protein